MHKLTRNKEGVVGFNCEACSAWNPLRRGSKARFGYGSRFALSCASCGAMNEVAVMSAVGFRYRPYLCEDCGKITSVKPRFEGTTAVLTCEHCGAETRPESVSNLNQPKRSEWKSI